MISVQNVLVNLLHLLLMPLMNSWQRVYDCIIIIIVVSRS